MWPRNHAAILKSYNFTFNTQIRIRFHSTCYMSAFLHRVDSSVYYDTTLYHVHASKFDVPDKVGVVGMDPLSWLSKLETRCRLLQVKNSGK
jgi:hypothetical protein